LVTLITQGGATYQGVASVGVDYINVNGNIVPFTAIASISLLVYPTHTPV
jgi:hypothetical protein